MFLLYLLSISFASNHMLIPNVVNDQHNLSGTPIINVSKFLTDGFIADKHFLQEIAHVTPDEVNEVVSLVQQLVNKTNQELALLAKSTDAAQKDQKQAAKALVRADQALKDKIDQKNRETAMLVDQKKVLNEVLSLLPTIHGCPLNTVVYGKYCYATMDYKNCNPDSKYKKCTQTCQNSYMAMPSGWQLVPYTSAVKTNIVDKHGFGTHCLIFSNGQSYYGAASQWRGKDSGADQLLRSGSKYKARGCSYKVLIRKSRAK